MQTFDGCPEGAACASGSRTSLSSRNHCNVAKSYAKSRRIYRLTKGCWAHCTQAKRSVGDVTALADGFSGEVIVICSFQLNKTEATRPGFILTYIKFLFYPLSIQVDRVVSFTGVVRELIPNFNKKLFVRTCWDSNAAIRGAAYINERT